MKQLAKRLPRAVRHPYFPLILILIANILAGLCTFQDYGLSWDEPLFYQYGEAVPYAYSIPAHLSGDFNIENAYGPSAEDHKIYGPIYLLLAKPVVDFLDWALPVPRADLWHLVNFLTYQIGVTLFFALCLRWMGSWAAFGATLLLSTQPVLWGHSWINPKDIPFTVFFIGTIYFGFKMVDALVDPASVTIASKPVETPSDLRRWQVWRKAIQVLALAMLILTLGSYIFSAHLQGVLRDLIHSAYQASPQSLLGRIFGYLAANAQSVAEEAYINKGLALFFKLRSTLAVLSALLLIPGIVLTFWSAHVERAAVRLANNLAPLPARPAWRWRRIMAPGVMAKILLAGILLGLLTSIRVIGPLAGALVWLYFFLKHERRSFAGLIFYVIIAVVAMYFAWPYLWDAPLTRFVEVLQHMAHNPKVLPVLFQGIVYGSDKLPFSYLPVMLGITLTWPVWPMFVAGVVSLGVKVKYRMADWRSLTPVFLWFIVPFVYVLVFRPPMYDGYRHFQFLLPPVFILCGLVFQALGEYLRYSWRYALILLVLILPGVIGLLRSHPYEYTYYNQLTGGTGGAFRRYETDFWLTCYKELMSQLEQRVTSGTTLFVHRQPSIAMEYASPDLIIERFEPQDDRTFPGSLLLLTTRANSDLPLHPEAAQFLSVGREGATFCLVKEIP